MSRAGVRWLLLLGVAASACDEASPPPGPPTSAASTLVGETAGGEALVAIASDGESLVAYTCGTDVGRWIRGTLLRPEVGPVPRSDGFSAWPQ